MEIHEPARAGPRSRQRTHGRLLGPHRPQVDRQHRHLGFQPVDFVGVKEQRASIEAIGGVQTLIEIDTCRGLLVSEPERLAEILVDRCRLHSR